MIEQSKFADEWGAVVGETMADAGAAQTVRRGGRVKVATVVARNGDHVDVIWEAHGFGLSRDGQPITGLTRALPVLLSMVSTYPIEAPAYEGGGQKVIVPTKGE